MPRLLESLALISTNIASMLIWSGFVISSMLTTESLRSPRVSADEPRFEPSDCKPPDEPALAEEPPCDFCGAALPPPA